MRSLATLAHFFPLPGRGAFFRQGQDAMKISEAIEILKDLEAKHGDLDLLSSDGHGARIEHSWGEDLPTEAGEFPNGVLIVD